MILPLNVMILGEFAELSFIEGGVRYGKKRKLWEKNDSSAVNNHTHPGLSLAKTNV
jgi:hypothetical protein